jgi:hypothetical protein
VKLLAWCAALLLLVGVAVGLDEAGPDADRRRPASATSRPFALGGVELAAASSLRGFDDCDELLGYVREEATRVGPGSVLGGTEEDLAFASRAVAESAAGGSAEAPGRSGAPATTATADDGAGVAEVEGGATDSFSGTNLQEVDVDEPDTVKTDGDVIVAVAGAELHVIEPADEGPRLLATCPSTVTARPSCSWPGTGPRSSPAPTAP